MTAKNINQYIPAIVTLIIKMPDDVFRSLLWDYFKIIRYLLQNNTKHITVNLFRNDFTSVNN